MFYSNSIRPRTPAQLAGIETLETREMLSNNSFLDLSSLDKLLGNVGTNGSSFFGTTTGQGIGYSVAIVGDVNGDGYDDFVIGAGLADPSGRADAGEAYLIFGSATGVNPNLKLADLDGTNGVKITGALAGDLLGLAVAGAGDVNGDGYDDFLIGSPGGDVNTSGDDAGRAYLIYGASTFSATLDVYNLTGTRGMTIGGNTGDNLGYTLAKLGDVNGDGYDDFGISSRGATGRVLVIFGKPSLPATLLTSNLNGSNGFLLEGVNSSDLFGATMTSAGDMNGDGYDEIAVGAYQSVANGRAQGGRTYVIYGKSTFGSKMKMTELNGTNGFAINGATAGSQMGRSLAGGGDINGDGLDDLLLGGPLTSAGTPNSGQVYVVYGKTSAFPTYVNRSDLLAGMGTIINGLEGSYTGLALGMGDINGDGLSDMILGSFGGGLVIQGQTGLAGSEMTWDEIDISKRDQIMGTIFALGSGGDVNGDGRDDIVIGNPNAAPSGGSNGGGAYVALGWEFNNIPQTAVSLTIPEVGGTYGLFRDGDFIVFRHQTGSTLMRRHVDTVSAIAITGSKREETIMIDFGSGDPIPAGGLSIDLGDEPSSKKDQLIITGGAFERVSYNQFANGSGNATLIKSGTSHAITFTGLESLQDTLLTTKRHFQFGSDSDKVTIGDNGTAGDGISRISRTGWDMTLDFVNPIAQVEVGGGSGHDTIDLNALDTLANYTHNNGLRISGAGYFALKTPTGIVYANSVTFDIDEEGRVITSEGWIVQGWNVDPQYQIQSTVADLKIDFEQLDEFRASHSNWGALTGITILTDGRVIAQFAAGKNLVLGQITLAKFSTPNALVSNADAWTYSATATSGAPEVGVAGTSGRGTVVYRSVAINPTLKAQGNSGNDVVDSTDSGRSTLINGNVGNDTLVGSALADRIYGGSGNDQISGLVGNDTLFGNGGDDKLTGNLGDDLIRGDSGKDSIWGDAGHDSLDGGVGHDMIYGGEGNDSVEGSHGNDTLITEAGRDYIRAGQGHDIVDGGLDHDILDGEEGNDSILGGDGNDTLFGGDGRDQLIGEAGNDALNGQGGSLDTLAGGTGEDRYISSVLDSINEMFTIHTPWRT